ncbi:hypothetical protein PNOK_0716200 [Pyrrhoderma noxium]|uniref:Uncharacterized protein n=1 Tax=Pyrrhoderma noxium TaxID=2282107 RepID=A0A286UC12_9AGAM|nr:hypothetical protein PNOK_0716200 [Pyrrhoderma noxium]
MVHKQSAQACGEHYRQSTFDRLRKEIIPSAGLHTESKSKTSQDSSTMKFTLIPALLCAAVPVFASPFISFWPNQLLPRTNSGPEVLYPHSGTVWQAGAVHNVTWSTEGLSPPTCGAVLNTAIYLAKNDAFEELITTNFSLSRGRVEIYVPKVRKTCNDYQIVLKADTSNPSIGGSYSVDFVIVK